VVQAIAEGGGKEVAAAARVSYSPLSLLLLLSLRVFSRSNPESIVQLTVSQVVGAAHGKDAVEDARLRGENAGVMLV
jgi:hypothetical protein